MTDVLDEAACRRGGGVVVRDALGGGGFLPLLQADVAAAADAQPHAAGGEEELAWSVLGLWLMGMMTAAAVAARGGDPLAWSAALARKRLRRAMRQAAAGRRERAPLARQLAGRCGTATPGRGVRRPAIGPIRSGSARRGPRISARPRDRKSVPPNDFAKNRVPLRERRWVPCFRGSFRSLKSSEPPRKHEPLGRHAFAGTRDDCPYQSRESMAPFGYFNPTKDLRPPLQKVRRQNGGVRVGLE